jgi:hypothetical protein
MQLRSFWVLRLAALVVRVLPVTESVRETSASADADDTSRCL